MDTEQLDILGPCPICGREMVGGPSVQKHHLTPKSHASGGQGPQETVLLHAVCHRMVHKFFCERTLADHAEKITKLRDRPEMARFIAWVQKKPTAFTDPPPHQRSASLS